MQNEGAPCSWLGVDTINTGAITNAAMITTGAIVTITDTPRMSIFLASTALAVDIMAVDTMVTDIMVTDIMAVDTTEA